VTGWRGAALTELRKLFAERPVWSVLALQERMPNAKTANDSELLAKVAYVFRSGGSAHFRQKHSDAILSLTLKSTFSWEGL